MYLPEMKMNGMLGMLVCWLILVRCGTPGACPHP